MTNVSPSFPSTRIVYRLSVLGLLLCAGGCGGQGTSFRLNRVYLEKQESASQFDLTEEQEQGIADVLSLLFGTPDQPHVPELDDVDIADILSIDRLRIAAGRVSSDRQGRPRGLYREHCAHCHGLSGNGAGPTAVFLDPYPRDFRRGIFKYKSTAGPLTPPTHEDLLKSVRDGNPGTAMPSFRLLDDDELESLVHYVRYLSIRGEVERALIFESIDTLEDEYDFLVEMALREDEPDEFEEQMDFVRSIVSDVVQRWMDAPSKLTEVPPKPEEWDLAESIRKGGEWYAGNVANCGKCHGETGLGDGQTEDYDDWTKEIVDPLNPDAAAKYTALGALWPRHIRPRNFRRGIFRGGSRPADLYIRIHNGIAGTPMPAAPLKPHDAASDDVRLGSEDIWHLVDYVLSLSAGPNGPLDNIQ
jgi:mono/diheme cytochrome c family protein